MSAVVTGMPQRIIICSLIASYSVGNIKGKKGLHRGTQCQADKNTPSLKPQRSAWLFLKEIGLYVMRKVYQSISKHSQ